MLFLLLLGYSQLEFNGTDLTLSVQSFEGDKTGTLFVHHNQVLFAEITDGRSSHMTTHINIDSGQSATLAFPSDLSIDQTELVARGPFDAQKVTVEENSILTLMNTSYTVRRTRTGFDPISTPGSYLFSSLSLKRSSAFYVDGGLTLTGGAFEVKSGVSLRFEFFDISSASVTVERDAALDASGMSAKVHPSAGLYNKCYISC